MRSLVQGYVNCHYEGVVSSTRPELGQPRQLVAPYVDTVGKTQAVHNFLVLSE